jgi:hypothetical protein
MDPVTFNPGGISVLLVNMEETNTFRPSDPYRRVTPDGKFQRVEPEIWLNLFVLFVSRHSVYHQALDNLSAVIQFFQNHRVFKHPDAVGMSPKIEQLEMELVTLPFGEQNEVWGALRVAYHPSALYRVRVIIFEDESAVDVARIEEREVKTSQLP